MKLLLIALLVSSSVIASSDFIPEASGATKVGLQIVIAGDEEPKSLWILENGELTKTSVKGAAWDDMEAMATVSDDTFFAITSHSLTKKGKRRPEREQLFLMKLDKKITVVESWSLRAAVLEHLESSFGEELDMNEVSTASPDKGGMNVEGMAYVGSKLYIGLRSPITKKGEAIVLILDNAMSEPEIVGDLSLRLSGRGIRGLETSGKDLIVLSGSSNDESETFGLHRLNKYRRN
ncbi:MAG TPA: DUF3616 domain-containing protein [Bacteriovoracaceae bacterium]|nr:DUF3616 domain-containing protein [Bacteriovoracaceae bacterium]